jgi:hypothetical protein
MLAALVPHGAEAWSFKLAGLAEAVGKNTDKFDALVQSVRFPDDAAGKPQWTLPDGWTQEAGGNEMRFATVKIPDTQTELTVAKVTWDADHQSQAILANVNRWRGQMQLSPMDETDLADGTRSLTLAADRSNAIVVDITGRLKPGGMSPPFASGADKGALPAGHPPVGEKSTNAAKKPPESAKGADASPRVAADPNLPFTYDLPAGWHPAPLKTFSVATFALETGSQKVEITVTPFGGGAGGLLMNVNRWRGQVHLPPASDDELKSLLSPYRVDGRPAQMVRLFSPKSADPPLAIVAVVADRDDATWFFRMSGAPELAEEQQSNFDKFMASIKFK